MNLRLKEQGVKLGERIAILLDKSYSESHAIKACSRVIYFRWLDLESLAGYLTRENVLGQGTRQQQVDKLKLLGFEENIFGAALVFDWDDLEKKTPNHLFYYEMLLSISRTYDEIEEHNSIAYLRQETCRCKFLESTDKKFDCPENKKILLCTLTQSAIFRTLDDFKGYVEAFLEDHFLYYEHDKLHIPSQLQVFMDNHFDAIT